MTDDHPTAPPDPAQAAPVSEVHALPDHTLSALVGTVNAIGGMEVGVTVYSGGIIISGLLISGRSYFDQLSDTMAEQGDVAAAIGTALFRRTADGYREKENSNRDDKPEDRDPDKERPVGFIHLRAATVHGPGPGPWIEQGLWRGRLTAVTGWSLGTFGPKPGPLHP